MGFSLFGAFANKPLHLAINGANENFFGRNWHFAIFAAMVKVKATPELIALGYKSEGGCVVFAGAKSIADVRTDIERKGGSTVFVGTKATAVDAASLDAVKLAFPNFDFSAGTIFKAVIANNRTDRDNERFGDALLSHWADQLKKQPISVCWEHNRAMHGYGKCFGGMVSNGNLEAYLLVSNTAKSPIGETLVDSIKAGFVDNLSVGFRAFATEERQPDGNYQWVWDIRPDAEYTKAAELAEVSFVAYASQYGASVKSAAAGMMELTEVTEPAKTEILPTMEYTIQIGGKSFALKIADGKLEGLEAAQAAVKSAEDAAKAVSEEVAKFRAPLEADVVNAKSPGLTEAVVKAMPADALIEAAKAVVGQPVKEGENRNGHKSTKYEKY